MKLDITAKGEYGVAYFESSSIRTTTIGNTVYYNYTDLLENFNLANTKALLAKLGEECKVVKMLNGNGNPAATRAVTIKGLQMVWAYAMSGEGKVKRSKKDKTAGSASKMEDAQPVETMESKPATANTEEQITTPEAQPTPPQPEEEVSDSVVPTKESDEDQQAEPIVAHDAFGQPLTQAEVNKHNTILDEIDQSVNLARTEDGWDAEFPDDIPVPAKSTEEETSSEGPNPACSDGVEEVEATVTGANLVEAEPTETTEPVTHTDEDLGSMEAHPEVAGEETPKSSSPELHASNEEEEQTKPRPDLDSVVIVREYDEDSIYENEPAQEVHYHGSHSLPEEETSIHLNKEVSTGGCYVAQDDWYGGIPDEESATQEMLDESRMQDRVTPARQEASQNPFRNLIFDIEEDQPEEEDAPEDSIVFEAEELAEEPSENAIPTLDTVEDVFKWIALMDTAIVKGSQVRLIMKQASRSRLWMVFVNNEWWVPVRSLCSILSSFHGNKELHQELILMCNEAKPKTYLPISIQMIQKKSRTAMLGLMVYKGLWWASIKDTRMWLDKFPDYPLLDELQAELMDWTGLPYRNQAMLDVMRDTCREYLTLHDTNHDEGIYAMLLRQFKQSSAILKQYGSHLNRHD